MPAPPSTARHTSPFKRTPVIRISAKNRGKSPGGFTKRWSVGKGAFKFLTQSAALSVFNNNNNSSNNNNDSSININNSSNRSSGKKQSKATSPEESTKVMSSTPKVTPVTAKPGPVQRKRFSRFAFKRSFSLFSESPLPNTYSMEKCKQYRRATSVQSTLSPEGSPNMGRKEISSAPSAEVSASLSASQLTLTSASSEGSLCTPKVSPIQSPTLSRATEEATPPSTPAAPPAPQNMILSQQKTSSSAFASVLSSAKSKSLNRAVSDSNARGQTGSGSGLVPVIWRHCQHPHWTGYHRLQHHWLLRLQDQLQRPSWIHHHHRVLRSWLWSCAPNASPSNPGTRTPSGLSLVNESPSPSPTLYPPSMAIFSSPGLKVMVSPLPRSHSTDCELGPPRRRLEPTGPFYPISSSVDCLSPCRSHPELSSASSLSSSSSEGSASTRLSSSEGNLSTTFKAPPVVSSSSSAVKKVKLNSTGSGTGNTSISTGSGCEEEEKKKKKAAIARSRSIAKQFRRLTKKIRIKHRRLTWTMWAIVHLWRLLHGHHEHWLLICKNL